MGAMGGHCLRKITGFPPPPARSPVVLPLIDTRPNGRMDRSANRPRVAAVAVSLPGGGGVRCLRLRCPFHGVRRQPASGTYDYRPASGWTRTVHGSPVDHRRVRFVDGKIASPSLTDPALVPVAVDSAADAEP